MRKLLANFDRSVVVVMCLAYFLQGFKIFLTLQVRDLYKHDLQLEPDETQFYTSVINLPWIFKIVYGLISDNLPIRGSNRRAYIILHSACQSAIFFMLIIVEVKDPIVITVLLTIT